MTDASSAPRLGVTGHRALRDLAGWAWVRVQLHALLDGLRAPPVGLTSLAPGADQLFAEVVLERGGRLHVVLPFPGYEMRLREGEEREAYARLLARAHHVETLPARESDEHGYMAAGERVVELADVLAAVWNGKPAAALSGTGDVVACALAREKPVVHLDADARVRRELNAERVRRELNAERLRRVLAGRT